MKTRAVALVASILVLSGCGLIGGSGSKGGKSDASKETNMNMQEAADHGEGIIDATLKSKVTGAPRKPLEPGTPEARGLPCIHSDFWSASNPITTASPTPSQ
jgi:hypothetical protein